MAKSAVFATSNGFSAEPIDALFYTNLSPACTMKDPKYKEFMESCCALDLIEYYNFTEYTKSKLKIKFIELQRKGQNF